MGQLKDGLRALRDIPSKIANELDKEGRHDKADEVVQAVAKWADLRLGRQSE